MAARRVSEDTVRCAVLIFKERRVEVSARGIVYNHYLLLLLLKVVAVMIAA